MKTTLVPLADVVAINPRKFTNQIEDSDTISFVPMKAVEEETGNLDASTLRPWHEVKKGYTAFEENDILFAKITPCMENGKFALAKGLAGGRGSGSTEFHVLRPSEKILPRYLLHFIFQHHIRRDARMNMRGAAGQLRVPTSFFESLQIPLPPLPTQHRIVQALEEKLSRLDAAQSALLRAQANLKRYRDLTVLEAVTGGRESLNKTWSPDDSPGLPAGWRWEPLAALASLTGGLAKSTNRKTVQTRRLVPYLRVANVQRGYLNLQEIKEIEATEAEIKDLRLEHHDILFNEGGDRDKLGRGWLWESQVPEAIHQNHVFRARADRSKVLPLFLSYCGNSYGAAWFWKHGKQTTNLASISLRVLRAFPIALPPLETQHKIIAHLERQLSVIDRTEQSLQTQLARAKRLRQSILQQAFAPAEAPA
ncbi:MAG: restriction endonuclease subunit S [Polaromonas sp.]